MDWILTGLQDLFGRIMDGDASSLKRLYAGEPLIDTPLTGRVKGNDAFDRFVKGQQGWLREHRARPEVFAVTATDDRVAVEFALGLFRNDHQIDLPAAVVADCTVDGVAAIRVYHSTWPLTGRHRMRPPILSSARNLEEPDIIRRYTAGLRAGETEAVLALFEEDGYVREPSGAQYLHSGRRGQREFYGAALAAGGILLEHCTATFDGTRCAIEYICDGWGRELIPPQAGVAVYELGASGRLRAARIYDDISPPGEE